MPQPLHGYVGANLTIELGVFVKARDLGRVTGNDSFVVTRQDPDRVRGADICYWSFERLPRGPMPGGLIRVPPDLVGEVRSPSDRWPDVYGKISEYLRADVRVVLILDPDTRTASVYRPEEIQQVFSNGGDLTIPDVLPGFSIPVARIFD